MLAHESLQALLLKLAQRRIAASAGSGRVALSRRSNRAFSLTARVPVKPIARPLVELACVPVVNE